MDNKISKPSHYQFEYPCSEVRDVINERLRKLITSEYSEVDILYDYSNTIKYILRAFSKNGLEDLYKANETLNAVIARLEANGFTST